MTLDEKIFQAYCDEQGYGEEEREEFRFDIVNSEDYNRYYVATPIRMVKQLFGKWGKYVR